MVRHGSTANFVHLRAIIENAYRKEKVGGVKVPPVGIAKEIEHAVPGRLRNRQVAKVDPRSCPVAPESPELPGKVVEVGHRKVGILREKDELDPCSPQKAVEGKVCHLLHCAGIKVVQAVQLRLALDHQAQPMERPAVLVAVNHSIAVPVDASEPLELGSVQVRAYLHLELDGKEVKHHFSRGRSGC